MASITRHWSTVLNGMQVDLPRFKQETDHVMQLARREGRCIRQAQ